MNATLHILRYLGSLRGNLITEVQLRVDIQASVTPAPTGADISDGLELIQQRGWAVSQHDPIDGSYRWRITPAGDGELAARGLTPETPEPSGPNRAKRPQERLGGVRTAPSGVRRALGIGGNPR